MSDRVNPPETMQCAASDQGGNGRAAQYAINSQKLFECIRVVSGREGGNIRGSSTTGPSGPTEAEESIFASVGCCSSLAWSSTGWSGVCNTIHVHIVTKCVSSFRGRSVDDWAAGHGKQSSACMSLQNTCTPGLFWVVSCVRVCYSCNESRLRIHVVVQRLSG